MLHEAKNSDRPKLLKAVAPRSAGGLGRSHTSAASLISPFGTQPELYGHRLQQHADGDATASNHTPRRSVRRRSSASSSTSAHARRSISPQQHHPRVSFSPERPLHEELGQIAFASSSSSPPSSDVASPVAAMMDKARHLREDPVLRPVELSDVDASASSESSDSSDRNSVGSHNRRKRSNRMQRTPSPPPVAALELSPSLFSPPARNNSSAMMGHLDPPQSPLALAERDYAMRDLRASLTELARVHEDLKRRFMRHQSPPHDSTPSASTSSPVAAAAGHGDASPLGTAAPPSAAHRSVSPAADELAAHIRALTVALEEAKAMAARPSVTHPQERSDPIAITSPAAVQKNSSLTTSLQQQEQELVSPSSDSQLSPHPVAASISHAVGAGDQSRSPTPPALSQLRPTVVSSVAPQVPNNNVRSPSPPRTVASEPASLDALSDATTQPSTTADGRGESPPWRPRMLPTSLNNHPRSMKGSVMKGILAAAAVEQARRAAQQYQAQPQIELPPNSSSVNNHMGGYLGMPVATQMTTLAQRAKKERTQWPSLEQLLVASRAAKVQSQSYTPPASAGTDVSSAPAVSSSAPLPYAATSSVTTAAALSSQELLQQQQPQPQQHQHHLSPEDHAREVRAVARVRQFTELQARKAREISRSPQRSASPSRPPIPPAPVRSSGPLSLPLLSPHSMPVVILPAGGSAGVATMPGSARRRGRRKRRGSLSSSSADDDADDGVDNGNEAEDLPSSNRSTPAGALSPAVQSRQGVVTPASLGQSEGLSSPAAQVPEDSRALLRDGDITAASRGRGRRSRGGPSSAPSTAPRSPVVQAKRAPSSADGGDPLLMSSSRRSSVDSSSGAASSKHSSEPSSPIISDADTEVEAEEKTHELVGDAADISPRAMQSHTEPVSDLSSGRDFLSVPGSSMLSHPLPSVAEESGSNLSASPPLPTQAPNPPPPPSSHRPVVAVSPLKAPAVTEFHASSSAPAVRYSPRMNPVAPAPVLGQTPFVTNHPHVPVTAADTVVSPLSPSSRAEARRLDELRRYEQENAPSSPAVVQAVIDALIPPSLQLAPPSPRQGPRPRRPAPDVVFSASASPQVHPQQQQQQKQDNDLPDLQLANSTSPPSVGSPAHSVLADGADPSSVPISRADLMDLQAAVASLDAARRAREEAQALEWTRQFEAKWAEKQSRHARRSGGGCWNQHHQYLHTNARSSGPVRNGVAVSPGTSGMTALARSMSQPSNLMTLRDPRALVAEMDLMSPSNGGGRGGADAVAAAIAEDSTGEDNGAVDGGSNGTEPAVLSPRSLLQFRLNNERASAADAKQRMSAFSSRWNGGGGGGGESSARLAVPAGVPDVDIADPLELPLSSSPESEISASPPPFGQGTGNNAEAGTDLDGTAAPVSQSLRSRASFRRRMQDLALQGQFFLKSAMGSSPISNGVSSPPPFSGGHVLHDLCGSTATPPTLGQHPAQLYGYVSNTDGGAAGASSPLAVITPSVSSPMLIRGEPPICAAGEGGGGGSDYRAPPPQGTVLHALANSHALSSAQLREKG